jgi:hypothetical protein
VTRAQGSGRFYGGCGPGIVPAAVAPCRLSRLALLALLVAAGFSASLMTATSASAQTTLTGVQPECVIQQRWAERPGPDGQPVILIDRTGCKWPITWTPSLPDTLCGSSVATQLYWQESPDPWFLADGSTLTGWRSASVETEDFTHDIGRGTLIVQADPSSDFYTPVVGQRILGTDYVMAFQECGLSPDGTVSFSPQYPVTYVLRGPGALGAGGGLGGGGGPAGGQEQERVERFRLTFMTFIPANYLALPHPEATCVDVADPPGVARKRNRRVKALIGHGDDRGYDPRAADRRPGDPHSYRSLQEVTIDATWRGDQLVQVRPVPGSAKARVGISESYLGRGVYGDHDRRFGALDHGKKGVIDPSDKDKNLNDCRLRHGRHQGQREGVPEPTASPTGPTTVRVRLKGAVRNGLIIVSPKINWMVDVDVDFSAPQPRTRVQGRHDNFPAYEMYLDQTPIYRWRPPALRGKRLPVRKVGGAITGLFADHAIPLPVFTPLFFWP